VPAPGQLDLTIYRGATFRKKFVFKDSAGNAVDITGATIRMSARPYRRGRMVTLDFTPYITLTNAAGGEATLEMTPAQTEVLEWNQAVYDMEVEMATGDVYRVLQGSIMTDAEVTR